MVPERASRSRVGYTRAGRSRSRWDPKSSGGGQCARILRAPTGLGRGPHGLYTALPSIVERPLDNAGIKGRELAVALGAFIGPPVWQLGRSILLPTDSGRLNMIRPPMPIAGNFGLFMNLRRSARASARNSRFR